MEELLALIISGHYSDWFFNVLMTNITLAIKNNLSLLLIISFYFAKFANATKNTWDNKISDWIRNKLTGVKENGGVIPMKPKQKENKND